jgi:integrase
MEKATFWELRVGEIKGVSMRKRLPVILTAEQYLAVVEELDEPYKQMVQVAMCLGLRVSEVLALTPNI